jgi:hypothetical protein
MNEASDNAKVQHSAADTSPNKSSAMHQSNLPNEPSAQLSPIEFKALYYGGAILIFVAELIFVAAAFVVIYKAVTGEVSGLESTQAILSVLLPPAVLMVAAAASTLFGFLVLRSVGAVNRLVIPVHDRDMLRRMIEKGNDKGIDQYIRLISLSGPTGFFQKIGISGLPLATIFLSLVFGILAFTVAHLSQDQSLEQTFSDLAKLTLGAFLGSYVQRQQSENTAEIKRLHEHEDQR